MKILVTGAAGFIGFHLCKRLLAEGHLVTGIDSLNDYYDPKLKLDRLALLEHDNFCFHKFALEDKDKLFELASTGPFDCVLNMAAQAGVRYSIDNPGVYIQANLLGFGNLLEFCRHFKVSHFIYASSSSVYGLNSKMPFAESDNVDHPISLYAATKKSNELMAHTYSYLYGLPCTGLRFFTVYGPWGRPDMALFKFTRAILADEAIDVYNNGRLARDFTYIDDIVQGVVSLIGHVPVADPSWSGLAPNPATSPAPYRIYNIGNNSPVQLEDFISTLEHVLGKSAKKNYLPMQPGDVESTYADISFLSSETGFLPSTPLIVGVSEFVTWYKSYYGA